MAIQQQFFFMETESGEKRPQTVAAQPTGSQASTPPARSREAADDAPTSAVWRQPTGTPSSNPPARSREAADDAPTSAVWRQPTGTPSSNPPARSREAADEPPNRDAVLKTLRAKAGCISTARANNGETFSTGCAVIDSWLPSGGLHPQALTQWIASGDSAAAGSLAMSAAANRLRQIPQRPLVIVDCQGTFYPPAAVALGVPGERIILLRPRSGADAIWAIDQSLRSGAVAAVWASLPMQIDDRDARRLQLAAETGRTPGLLVRGFAARGTPSFTDVQFYVSQQQRQVMPDRRDFEIISVTLDRVRGGVAGRQLDVQIDDRANLVPISPHTHPLDTHDARRHETAAKHLASQLANPKTAQRAERRPRTAS